MNMAPLYCKQACEAAVLARPLGEDRPDDAAPPLLPAACVGCPIRALLQARAAEMALCVMPQDADV